jgi:hypothetical protein
MLKKAILFGFMTATVIIGNGCKSGSTATKTDAGVEVKAGAVLLETNFDEMKLGGDIIGNKQGIILDVDRTPWDISSGALSLPSDPVYKSCPASTLGPILLGNAGEAKEDGSRGSISEEYKKLRKLEGYTGMRIFEQPGYVTFGHSKGDAYLVTPPLKGISQKADVKLSFKVGRRSSSKADTQLTVSVMGGGAIRIEDQGTPSKLVNGGIDLPIDEKNVWIQKELIITGATSRTKIKFENTIREVGSRNFSLDDLIVTAL